MRVQKNLDYYILLFFSMAFVGWIWEVALYFVLEHTFINRGVYKGPYLPIYGFGALLLYVLLRKYRKKRMSSFLLSAMICTILEYASSWYLEWNWGIRWWDYSERLWNINGRVCPLAALGFGIGGMVLNCHAFEGLEKIYGRIPLKCRMWCCAILLTIFILDATYCAISLNVGYGITG